MQFASHPTIPATIVLVLLIGHPLAAESTAYERELKPILQARCYACHGALKQAAGLRLDTGELIRRGGDSGSIVDPKQPAESLLIERLKASDESERMPPEGQPVTPAQIESFRQWIADGATSPVGERPESDPGLHWSFQPLGRPPVPISLVGREASPEKSPPIVFAPSNILFRRIYLDLIGLPPTAEELQEFLADDSPDAWDRVVDRLLNDPRYGERWARHWMDVWRYADWYGRRHVPDVWNSAPQVWRWRDWIVDSLNQDKGYDQMIREMLAGDEISAADPDLAVATGYLIRNWYALNPNDWMRNTVEHTGKAFLGLTFNCAHCHDHKYDPITHEDYFRLRAFFEPMYVRQDRVPGEADPGPFQDYDYSTLRKVQQLGAVRVFDKSPDAPTWFYTGGDERNRLTELGSIEPGVPDFLSTDLPEIERIELPPVAWYPTLDPDLQATMLADADMAITTAAAELNAAKQSVPQVPSEVQERLAAAERQLEEMLGSDAQANNRFVIAGKQSLVLDATTGRRIINNRLAGIERFDSGMTIQFELLLLTDAHFNFQLAKDADEGLTAGYVAFDQGRLVAYRPGSFSEFEVGKYSFSADQRRFTVRLVFHSEQDVCELMVRSVSDDRILVDNTPVALNGWNPIGDPTKAITLDAHTGSVVVVDDLRLSVTRPTESQDLASFGFEPPLYRDGSEIVGTDGWEESTYSAGPANSIASSEIVDPERTAVRETLTALRLAARLPKLHLSAAQAKVDRARSSRLSLQARIDAENAKFGLASGPDPAELARNASQLEYVALIDESDSEVRSAELALASATAKSKDDQQRAEAITAARERLAEARERYQKHEAAKPAADSTAYTPLGPTYPKTSTGRRRALADWIAHPANPLTARVAVNHIWKWHFHAPLVPTVDDFGRNGAEPADAALLDWLAVKFIESDWSMKHLHRLILTSAAYRQSAKVQSATQFRPADGKLYPLQLGRMDAEVLRDSLLFLGRQLDPTMGGRPLENKVAATTHRRSLYYEVYPEDGGASQFGSLFDAPDPLECYRRTRSIVPQQALALTNSELIHSVSTAIVQHWTRAHPDGDDGQFIGDMFRLILSRGCSDDEQRLCRQGLAQQFSLAESAEHPEPPIVARESLVRVLLNHNDFITIR